jgi:hypothetical protein
MAKESKALRFFFTNAVIWVGSNSTPSASDLAPAGAASRPGIIKRSLPSMIRTAAWRVAPILRRLRKQLMNAFLVHHGAHRVPSPSAEGSMMDCMRSRMAVWTGRSRAASLLASAPTYQPVAGSDLIGVASRERERTCTRCSRFRHCPRYDAAGRRVCAIGDVPGNVRRAYRADVRIAQRPDEFGPKVILLTNSAGPPAVRSATSEWRVRSRLTGRKHRPCGPQNFGSSERCSVAKSHAVMLFEGKYPDRRPAP